MQVSKSKTWRLATQHKKSVKRLYGDQSVSHSITLNLVDSAHHRQWWFFLTPVARILASQDGYLTAC